LEPQKSPTVRIQQRPDYQFHYELFDKINLTIPSKGVSDSFWIGGIEHRWMENTGQSVITTLYLQKIFTYGGGVDTESFDPAGDSIPDLPASEPSPSYDGYTDCCDYEEPLDMLPSCTDDNASPNGPYKVEGAFDMLSSGVYLNHFMPFVGTIRRASAWNTTFLELKGEFSIITSSGRTVDTDNSFFQVWAVGENDQLIAVGQYVAQIGNKFSTYSTRYFVFQTTTPQDIIGFRLVVTETRSQIITPGGTAPGELSYDLVSENWDNPNPYMSYDVFGNTDGAISATSTGVTYEDLVYHGYLGGTYGLYQVNISPIYLPAGTLMRLTSIDKTHWSGAGGWSSPVYLGHTGSTYADHYWLSTAYDLTQWQVMGGGLPVGWVDKIMYTLSAEENEAVSVGVLQIKLPYTEYLIRIKEIMAYNICG
jgi:hypothetical protein